MGKIMIDENSATPRWEAVYIRLHVGDLKRVVGYSSSQLIPLVLGSPFQLFKISRLRAFRKYSDYLFTAFT